MNKGEPVGGAKRQRQRAGKNQHNRKRNRLLRLSQGSELSDDDNFVLNNDDGGRQIVLPSRSALIRKLPKSFSGSASIDKSQASELLDKGRYKLVEAIKLVDENLRIIDSNGKVHLCMATKEPPTHLLTTSTRNLAAAGYVRDQDDHPLCWDFCVCDLVSASAVLYGHMKEYEPLSQMFLCQEVDREQYVEKVSKVDGERHSCYKCEVFRALKYVKQSKGIPRANEEEKSEEGFNCNVKRHFRKDEKRFGIKDVFRYDTLEDALTRLQIHPVAATLICFDGWEEEGVYVGPKENAEYVGGHAVLMIDCVRHNGKMVVRCKSSNGTVFANDGYIYVSVEVMIMVLGGTRKKGGEFTCLKKPTHLLCDFYSVDMDMGPYPAQIDEDEARKNNNSRHMVDFGK